MPQKPKEIHPPQTSMLAYYEWRLDLNLAISDRPRGGIWRLGDILAGKGLRYEDVVRDRTEYQPRPMKLEILPRLFMPLFILHWLQGLASINFPSCCLVRKKWLLDIGFGETRWLLKGETARRKIRSREVVVLRFQSADGTSSLVRGSFLNVVRLISGRLKLRRLLQHWFNSYMGLLSRWNLYKWNIYNRLLAQPWVLAEELPLVVVKFVCLSL